MWQKLYYTTRQEKYLCHLTMSHAIFLLGSKIAIGSLVFEILVLENFWKKLNIQSFSLILFLFPSDIAKPFIMILQILFLFNQFWWSSVGIKNFSSINHPKFVNLVRSYQWMRFDRIILGNQARTVTQM